MENILYGNVEVNPRALLAMALGLALDPHAEDLAGAVENLLSAYLVLRRFDGGDPKVLSNERAVDLYLKVYAKEYGPNRRGDILFPEVFPEGEIPRKFVVRFAKAVAQADRVLTRAYRQQAGSLLIF